ncbi:MAG: hypothetical protein JWP38_2462 [Herbaspirillum sp.]|nr:hypothetical protein [Herbaspirillum sp.]
MNSFNVPLTSNEQLSITLEHETSLILQYL